MEDALYETTLMRCFSRLSSDTSLLNHTIIMNFQHFLERHYLGRQIFETINQWLEDSDVLVKEGTSIDATIIEVPSSTKKKSTNVTHRCNEHKQRRKATSGILECSRILMLHEG